jgi:radical SAM superfamily enzyme YgiQ (UPF0313 family)
MSDVVLIHPGNDRLTYQGLLDDLSAVEPPTRMLLTAQYLRNCGQDVVCLDGVACFDSCEGVVSAALDVEPKLIVVFVSGHHPSASTQMMPASMKIAEIIKSRDSRIPIVFCGVHPAALPEQTLRESAIDFVLCDEAFSSLNKLVQALGSGGEIDTVPSLYYWKDGEVVHNPRGEELDEDTLNEMVDRPAWDLIPHSFYKTRYRSHNWHAFTNNFFRTPYVSLITSLGCPYRCEYCCVNAPYTTRQCRVWSSEKVLSQLDYAVWNYGVINIKIVDELFFHQPSRVVEILDLLGQRTYSRNLNIWAYARVDTIIGYDFFKLRNLGFRWIALGIESGNLEIRKKFGKAYTNDEIRDVVEQLREAEIAVIGNFMFGLPDDTLETMQETFELAKELNCDFANFYCTTAYPGSKLYDESVRLGKTLPESWGDYAQHAERFVPLANDNLTSEEILQFRDRAFTEYFSSEQYCVLLKNRFGSEATNQIRKILSTKLNRRLLCENL